MSVDKEPANVDVNNEKHSVKVCRICLRSDIIAKSIDAQVLDFYNDISDVNVFAHHMLSFCPLCEHKLRKFYNFKQRCIRSNYILKTKITNPGHMDLGSLLHLIPRDLGFSMPNDRRGLFDYKCHLFIAEQNLTETKQTNVFENDNLKSEVMIDTDLIKTEVDKLLEDPIKVSETDLILEKMETEFEDEIHLDDASLEDESIANDASVEDESIANDASVEDESIANDASVEDESIANDASVEDGSIETDTELALNNYDSDMTYYSDYDCESDLSECELPLRKNKTKTVLKNNLSGKKTDKQISIDAENEKITADQLSAVLNEPFDINDINYEDIKFVRKLLTPHQKNKFDFLLEVEKLKMRCLNLLDEGIDLGDVKMTKELFLELFAKCDRSYIKMIGVVNHMDNTPKVKKFMLYIHKRYNPEYETIFKIDYLITREQKIEEYESRKNSKQYIEALYKCEKCYLPFTHQAKLDFHSLKYHDPKLPLMCDICPARFPKRAPLTKHQIYHYSVYRCKLCAVFTYYFEGMLNHYNQHKGKLYTCDICLGQYGSKSTLNGHRLAHARFTCEICARKFHSQHYLDDHVQRKHANASPTRVESPAVAPCGKTSLSCDKCNAVFKSQIFLRRHMTKHETLFYKCRSSICNEKFSSASELREHTLSTGHYFSREDKAIVRAKSVQKGNPRLYKTCPVCHMRVLDSFPTSMYAHHHRLHPDVPYTHENEYNTLCEQCGQSFWHHSLYLDHLNTHTGEKPYACKDCDARYSTRRLLYSHRTKVHCRQHKCKDCGKQFYNRGSYINHIKVHTGEKPHGCHLCGKKFKQIQHLKTHILSIHTTNRPFSCELCNKKFYQKCNLSLHMAVHTGQRPYPCQLCDKQFYKKFELKAHVLKMHS